ncbi:uracil phosphoribosyltransferase [Companilactobacillus sp. RD055328]|uniref:CopY/TcrY family copper transport repressor n=1 Tax=Companilactobacillus sp. RD055328 TaxID=2916634 RepID=UPI001FC886A0|nr:CopY/TcrY family copper transport repressor [Companilactobacillus sp. RD055328]GKQ43092.1 uracil phosphoribosyltransferase [Companilactobacillus sp. RD055328]
MNKFEEVSSAEWQVMRILWTLNSATSSDIIANLNKKNNWNDSTIKTLIGRLVKKGIVEVDNTKRPFIYTSKYTEDNGIKESVNSMFDNICDMKKASAISDLIDDSPISKNDIDQLIIKLEEKRKSAPEKVACNCLKVEEL